MQKSLPCSPDGFANNYYCMFGKHFSFSQAVWVPLGCAKKCGDHSLPDCLQFIYNIRLDCHP